MSRRFIGHFEALGSKEITFKFLAQMAVDLTALFVLLLLITDASHSAEFKVRQNAQQYLVEATVGTYPLVLGDNRIEIEITDASGKTITDAEVLVNYYMPPMPRMVPMNYKTEARLVGKSYEAKMNIIMAGPWYIKIIIKHEGKIATTKLNVDAQ